jgi:cytoskeletal protein CcmA (bactofilin family)
MIGSGASGGAAAQCHVEADVFHQSLTIEQGAYFEGRSCRLEEPSSAETEPGQAHPKPRLVSGNLEHRRDQPLPQAAHSELG